MYIENEYGQYLLRGDVKIARSWHYSTRNADYDADEFQNVLEKISVLGVTQETVDRHSVTSAACAASSQTSLKRLSKMASRRDEHNASARS